MARQNLNGLNKKTPFFTAILCMLFLISAASFTQAETITITPPNSKFFDKHKTKEELSEEQKIQELLTEHQIEEDLNFKETGFLRSDKWLDRADYLIKTRQYSQAMGVVNQVITRNQQNAEALIYKGFLYKKLKDLKLARKYTKLGLAINPQHLGGLYQMALLDALGGDMAQAQEKLTLIRMYCGHTDCAEASQLEFKLDKFVE